jgi:4-hydroxybenzoate polyprenyltransferase
MHQEFKAAAADTPAVARPHWALRCAAACGAALAALAIALMAISIIQNWDHVPTDRVPWLPLAMLAFMLALLWSGITLTRRKSEIAILVFLLSALLGLPFTLFGLALAFSD